MFRRNSSDYIAPFQQVPNQYGNAPMDVSAHPSSALRLDQIGVRFHLFQALEGISFGLRKGEFFSMLGPSGSGKSTTLRVIAGFQAPSNGTVVIGGQDVSRLPPYRRNLGMVFQDYALFPHLSVARNVEYPLRARGIPAAQRASKVAEMLAIVGLTKMENRLPSQLSGGQQQRVALARALVFKPDILLLDEPLGALDKKLREQMQGEIIRITKELGATVVAVTHDQDEAMSMSDRIAVFSEGTIAQIGTPRELYVKPETRFVADFLGGTNILSGAVERRGLDRYLVGDGIRARLPRDYEASTAMISVRPECLSISDASSQPMSSDNRIEVTIERLMFLGSETRVLSRTGDGTLITVKCREGECLELQKGNKTSLTWEESSTVRLKA